MKANRDYYRSTPPPPINPVVKAILLLIFLVMAFGVLSIVIPFVSYFIGESNRVSLNDTWNPIILDNRGDLVQAVAFSPDGKNLAVGNKQGTVKLWEVASGKELSGFTGYKGAVHTVAFSPDGKALAAGGENNIVIWESGSGQQITTFPGADSGKQVNSLAFSPNGKYIAAGNEDGTIRVWDTTGWNKQVTFYDKSTTYTNDPRTNKVYSIAFSLNNDTIASGSDDGTVKLWKISRGKLQNTLSTAIRPSFSDERYVYSMAFSLDGKTLATGLTTWGQENIELWDVTSFKLIKSFGADKVQALAYSPDGQVILTGGENYITLWNVTTGKELARTIEPYKAAPPSHYIYDYTVAFSPDGKTLATGNTDGVLRLWKQKTAK